MGQAYRDLQVWQKSMELAIAVYSLSKAFPREEIYGITGQMRRSALSIPSNIAEGNGRNSVGEFKHFLGIARGSNYELQTQLEFAKAVCLGDAFQIDDALRGSHEVGKMIYGLMQTL